MKPYVKLPSASVFGPDPDCFDLDDEPIDHVYAYWSALDLSLEQQLRMLIEEHRLLRSNGEPHDPDELA